MRRRESTLPSVVIVAVVIGWITVVLLLDADGGRWLQRSLGITTWVVLISLLAREASLVRVQTAVVVVFAAAVEYTFSPLLEVYTYRFDNVPAYVPPGHGLVYLAALAIGRSTLVQRHARLCIAATLLAVGAYAVYGVTLADRLDVLGAFWFLCLVGFMRWGPSPGLYVGAAIVVTYLEIAGTTLGTWVWQPRDPTGLVAIGNPPSGAAGGYGWFDLAATLLAPSILHKWGHRRRRIGKRAAGSESTKSLGLPEISGSPAFAELSGSPAFAELTDPSDFPESGEPSAVNR